MVMDFLLKILQRLLSYYPVILPTFFILFRESAISVKIWQAVQRIPYTEPPKKDGEIETAPCRESTLKDYLKSAIRPIMVVIYIYVVFITVPILLKDAPAKLRIFHLCTISVPLVYLVGLATSTQSRDVVVVRDIEGKPVTIPPKDGDNSSLKRALSFAFGALVAVGGLWFGHPLAAFVVYAAYIHVIVRYGFISAWRTSFKILFCAAAFITVCTALAMLVLLVMIVLAKQSYHKPADTPGHPSSDEDIIFINWVQLYTSSLPWIVLFQFYIVSLAYRFDYANSFPLDFKPIVCAGAGSGFRIPRPTCFAIHETFPRPYFTTALVALFLPYVGVAAWFEYFSVEAGYELASGIPMFSSLLLVAPSMLLVAAMKGQLGKLWEYEEDWGAIPSINEGSEVSKVDTTLQKYGGEDEDGLVYELADHGGKVDFQGGHIV